MLKLLVAILIGAALSWLDDRRFKKRQSLRKAIRRMDDYYARLTYTRRMVNINGASVVYHGNPTNYTVTVQWEEK